MKKLLLACVLLASAFMAAPASATDSYTTIDTGDTYTIRVWDTDDSEYRVAFVCIPGEQPMCDMPNNFVMRYNGQTLEEVFGQFALSHHEHPITDIDGLVSALAAKQGLITPGAHIAAAATNAAANATTNAQTNASGGVTTNLPTNYNTLSGLLGIADGLNGANTAQNDLGTKYNALVGKYNETAGKYNEAAAKLNDLAGKYNDLAGKYNDLAAKHNTLVAQGILTP